MSEIVNQSLQKIAKGTGIIFTGTIIGMLLGFVGRIIIVRYITQSEYGIFSLALVLMSIFAMISTLGLQSGVTRQIAYFRGKKDSEKVRGIVKSSIQIALKTISLYGTELKNVVLYGDIRMSEMKNVVQKGGVKDMISKKHTKVTTGVFIPGEFLSQAEITEGDIEIEVANKEIRIYPAKSGAGRKVFTFDSPLWKCVGFVEIEGISGKEHDRYIYDEER